MPQFRAVRVDDPVAHDLLTDYFAMRVEGFTDRVYNTVYPDPAKFEPPAGVFIVAELDRSPVGCAGIRMLSPERAELKHLYVRDAARGQGIGGGLIAILEQCAIEFGATEIVLDTHDSLEAAGRLYARAGYREIEPYNENPNASNWYGKSLNRDPS
jgi:GNAT superfamily N-acetyltransferase